MSDLKEKAKTLVQIIRENCIELYNSRCKDCVGQCEFEGTENFAGKWVGLEDIKEMTKEIAKKIVLWIHEMDETVWLPCDEDIENKVEELLKEVIKNV